MSTAPATGSLCLSAISPRHITLRHHVPGARYSLPRPAAWVLTDMRSGEKRQGVTDRAVFSIFGLEPAANYSLSVEGAGPLSISTPECHGLVDARDHGADTLLEDNGAALARAIGATPSGGTLRITGGIYRTSPLMLKSGMTLEIAKDSGLAAIHDRGNWPILPAHDASGAPLSSWEGVPEAAYASLITALGCDNLTICGEGMLDGGGAEGDWWSWPKETRNGARRPRTVFLSRCTHVTLTGITVRNSPSWTVHPLFCRDLTAADLRIWNPSDSPNTDGLNPESSEDVRIEGVHFSVGDDCIAIKAGKPVPETGARDHLAPTRNVSVRNCLMERGHGGLVIGSEMGGGVHDVAVEHCSFSQTDRGLRIKTRRGRGGAVGNVRFSDCGMDGVDTAFVANAFYFCDADGHSDFVQSRTPHPVTGETPSVGAITIENIKVTNLRLALGVFLGLPEAPMGPIRISGVETSYDPAARADVPVMADHVPAMRHEDLVFEGAHVEDLRQHPARASPAA
ncbi:glycoside hydrolase family 28 protein [Pannonibacter sp. Pt2]|uniref:Glycoside hydrolase family 28 protein n=1 Tax=Pannonibacter anstelovis TaxID=3121537 RepID=A0ABU7ZQB5_9HYPH